jgi:hypothetical protein
MELGKNLKWEIWVSAADSVRYSVVDSVHNPVEDLVGSFNNSRYGIR